MRLQGYSYELGMMTVVFLKDLNPEASSMDAVVKNISAERTCSLNVQWCLCTLLITWMPSRSWKESDSEKYWHPTLQVSHFAVGWPGLLQSGALKLSKLGITSIAIVYLKLSFVYIIKILVSYTGSFVHLNEANIVGAMIIEHSRTSMSNPPTLTWASPVCCTRSEFLLKKKKEVLALL